MRSYRRVKELPQNTIADVGCKGLLIINADPALTLNIIVYSRNIDSTLKSITVELPSPNGALSLEELNYAIFPFHPEKWEVLGGIGSAKVYQLY